MSPTKSEKLGKTGEDIACNYLTEKGYTILERNYRKPWGEIDIVAKSQDGALVFVEVKALREAISSGLKPEDHLTKAKLEKVRRSCEAYCAKNPELVNEKKGWRIDLVAIEFLPDGSHTARHYEGI